MVWGVEIPCPWAAAPVGKRSIGALFRGLFQAKTAKTPRGIPLIPDAATPAEELSKEAPDYPLCETIKIFYSPDRLRRAVLLRRDDALYTYQLERLEILSEADWTYLCRGNEHPKPAMWQPEQAFGPSLFGTEEEALLELRADPNTQGWTMPAK